VTASARRLVYGERSIAELPTGLDGERRVTREDAFACSF
jgi:hypothetical protein